MSFDPVFTPTSKILILGTYPSPASREVQFYYGHRFNRFWPLMASLLDEQVPQSVDEKKRMLTRHDIALWDVLHSCDVVGAADSSITNPVPNPVEELVKQCPIRQVFLNGAKAMQLYQKFCKVKIDLPCLKLPSTSPANAQFSMQRLQKEWSCIRNFLD
ncbi:DNA-deoxyinosine glycosylase [Candidatus Soleaferrea massiliensis]|uniref:DNA-deoxyinosine glycosylase n=1 Tax=Candidatus Soleaferrea massiliensis TaxID=1470354 RepID=UPI00058BEF97|nr:DNA-deoxyinosine glycosylase [Candidatus Soleaferrea massiliensis]